MNVLIVEDDAQWAHIMAAILVLDHDTNAQVRITHTFREGWAAMVAQPWDVVFLDLTLPDSSRERTLEGILQMKAIGARRVAVVTGDHLTSQFTSRLLAAGADDCVSKNCATLQQCLLDVLSGRSVVGAC